MDAAFDYLLDLSQSMTGCDSDRVALLEAHAVLSAMDAECRSLSSVWPAFPADRRVRAARPLAA